MSIEAFVIRSDLPEEVFLHTFLNSYDFRVEDLKSICKDLNQLTTGRAKLELATRISGYVGRQQSRTERFAPAIVRHWVQRPRTWVSFKTGRTNRTPTLASTAELLSGIGDEQWYGPVNNASDDPDSAWYVRPVHVEHWAIDDHTKQPRLDHIRWLCWARVTPTVLSLHWNGFTRSADRVEVGRRNERSQFEYWEYVPDLFVEIEDHVGARVEHPDLNQLTLSKLWDRYHGVEGFTWLDTNIRSRSGGVAFSAHSGAVEETDVSGIRDLAMSIRKGISYDLRRLGQPDFSDSDAVDLSILRTLIKDLNPHSHGFTLRQGSNLLFNGHSYFGVRPGSRSQDVFPHVKLIGLREHTDVDRLLFLVRHLEPASNETHKATQLSLPSEA